MVLADLAAAVLAAAVPVEVGSLTIIIKKTPASASNTGFLQVFFYEQE